MKKKLISLLLATTMVIGLAACGGAATTKAPDATTTVAATTKAGETTVAEAPASGDLFDLAQYKSDKDKSEWTIAVVTKDNTAAWFKRMEQGVMQFGKDSGINVIQKGPANADALSQVQVVDDLINQGVDALCVIPIDPGALEESLKKALEKGIPVVTHEASNQVNTLFDVEAFTANDFGAAIMDKLASEMGKKGKYAIMIAYTTSTTHMEYATAEANHQKATYPDMVLINNGAVPSAESQESMDTAYERAKEILKANPDLTGFIGTASTDIPGIAKAVEELGLAGKVKIVGVTTPNEVKDYIDNGTVSALKLWDPSAAGYATVSVAAKILAGEEVGNGVDLGITGYESVTEVKGATRVLIGKADITVDKANRSNYDF